jgi:hypothetical protein
LAKVAEEKIDEMTRRVDEIISDLKARHKLGEVGGEEKTDEQMRHKGERLWSFNTSVLEN